MIDNILNSVKMMDDAPELLVKLSNIKNRQPLYDRSEDIKKYCDNCWKIYNKGINIEKLLKYAKTELYQIEAINGLRFATKNEIKQGVRGIICVTKENIDDENYKLLSILQWSFDWKWKYLSQAGCSSECKFEDIETDIGIIQKFDMFRKRLDKLCEYLDTEFESDIDKLKQISKQRKFEYASYEPDEVHEDISIKQIVQSVLSRFEKNSKNPDVRRAIALALKTKNNPFGMKPDEIAFMREMLSNHTEIESTNEGIKEKCERLYAERDKGNIGKDDFVFKIIETLSRYNYTRCSSKQLKIIDSALDKIESSCETTIISDDEISNELDIMQYNSEDMFSV
jgi:hypothetical protein